MSFGFGNSSNAMGGGDAGGGVSAGQDLPTIQTEVCSSKGH